MASTTHANADPTFGKYTTEQARQYAIGRAGSYPSELYAEILRFHETNGGQFQKLVDVGCGPGKATQDLAPLFDTVIGTDHSAAMIDVARSMNYLAKGGPIQFEVAPGEKFDLPGIEPGSVDMITAAMAAHWFDMAAFWPAAAKALKPGGTVALWTCSSQFCHPSTPNAEEVQKIMFDLEYNILGPYVAPGNKVSQDMYESLQHPWQVDPPVSAFSEQDFQRLEWNRGGKLEAGKDDFLAAGDNISLKDWETGLSTASMVTRWREANPDLVGTDEDCVIKTTRRMKEALGQTTMLTIGAATTLLLFKKAATS